MAYKTKRMITLIVFVAIQLLIIGLSIKSMGIQVIYDNIVITILFVVYNIAEIKYNIYMDNYIRVLLALIIISHNLFGELLNLYDSSKIFDKVLHIFGGYTFSIFAYLLVNNLPHGDPPSKRRDFVFILALGLSMGASFEIIEFFTDIVFNPTVPNQPSLIDTDLDLIANFVGAAFAAFHRTILKDRFS